MKYTVKNNILNLLLFCAFIVCSIIVAYIFNLIPYVSNGIKIGSLAFVLFKVSQYRAKKINCQGA